MKNSSYKHIGISVSVIILLIIIYQIFTILNQDDIFFPGINDIFMKLGGVLGSRDALLLLSLLGKILIVLVVSFLISLLIHFINYVFKYNVDIVNPIMFIIKACPFAIVSVYLYILLFKNKEIIPYIVCFLVVFPIVYEGVKQALSIDKDIVAELSLLPGPRYMKYTRIYVPLAISPMLITLLQGISLGVKVMVMAEYICSLNNSIGLIINNAKLELDFSTILAWLILLVVIIIIFDVSINLLKKKMDSLK